LSNLPAALLRLALGKLMDSIRPGRKPVSSKLVRCAAPLVLLAIFAIGSGLSSPFPRCLSADLYRAGAAAADGSALGSGSGDESGCQGRRSCCPLAGKKNAAEKSDACRSLLMKLKAQVTAKPSAPDHGPEQPGGSYTFLSLAPVSDYDTPFSFKDAGYHARSSPILLQKMSLLI
jgi:hypothetical protein